MHITINTRKIGSHHPAYIIAEIGTNHNRDFTTACKMIDAAAEAGVDAVKFQTFYPDEFISRHATPMDYGLDNEYSEATWQEVQQNHLLLPFAWYEELVPRIRNHGLHFMTTVTGERSLVFALKYKPDALKIASMDLTYTPFLRLVAKTGLPVIISLGMGTWADIERAVKVLESEGCENYVLMHCVSNYPAKYEDLHLRFLNTLQKAFLKPVGFSDHSPGVVSSVVAVSLGASVIEKHITLDRNAKGPEHPFSLEPSDLKRLVTEIRQTEQALGNSRRHLSDQERNNARKFQRRIVANGKLKAGDLITTDNVKFQRPGGGLPPYELERIVGWVVIKDLDDEDVLTWDVLASRLQEEC